jgi:hypothetical protein
VARAVPYQVAAHSDQPRSGAGASREQRLHGDAVAESARQFWRPVAVYLHTKLAGNPALPNFGEDLGRAAGRRLWGVSSLAALNDVRTPRPLGTVMDDMTAYILAGSFVEFLIDQHGLVLFRSLYETADYEKVYAKPFATLEKEWRASLSR